MRISEGWLVVVGLAACVAPLILAGQAQSMDFTHALEAPSPAHWFGTDSLGRDLFARTLCGASVSLGVSVVAALFSVVFGTALGAVAGYCGGWGDRLLMGFVDMMLCFPTFFLILAVVAVVGSGAFVIAVVIGVTSWMGTARLVRAEVLSLREREFVLASRALGAGGGWIVFRHLIPNALAPVIASAVLGVSAAILTEGGLSFLGVGVPPPMPSWGNILMEGKSTLGVAWWASFFPGMMIFLTVLSAHAIGENLDKRLKGERTDA
ncbi:MAG: ABC transporter permease [Candidatus Omnitrophica bacterium]|nr:ABC transporter permease [Candidatus Omnitrophota bacterium]